MIDFISLILLVVLMFIAIQDFAKHSVSLILYLLGIVLAAMLGYNGLGFINLALLVAVNMALVFMQLLVLFAYFSLKHKSFKSIFHYLGQGDLLFFIIASISFTTFNFVLFQVLTLICILLFHLAIVKFFKYPTKVPLAGYQAAFLFFVLVCDRFSDTFNRFSDIALN